MSRGQYRNQVPANYFVLPLADDGSRAPAPDHRRYEDCHMAGRLGLVIEITSDGIHAGTGLWAEAEGGIPFRDISSAADHLTLPGSGIKGAIRMIAEALSGSCGGDNRGCRYQHAGSRLCFACRVFGTLGVRGSIGFEEAFCVLGDDGDEGFDIAEIPLGYPPRPTGKEGRRFYGPPAHGLNGKVPYGVIRRGQKLRSALLFESVTGQELGIVLLALGLDGTFQPRLGGGKFAGLGQVRFSADDLRLRSAEAYGGSMREADSSSTAFVQRCLSGAEERLPQSGQRALAEIREQLAPAGDEG